MTMSETHDHTPIDLACLTAEDDEVFVVVGGAMTCEHHGVRHEFITIGVRDSDSPDDEVIHRDDFRELINIYPPEAIRLARFLLDYATDMIDSDDDDDDEQLRHEH
jgi:hypothetical protein